MIKMVQNGFWGTFYKNIKNYFLVETWLKYKLCAFWDICDYGVFRYQKHVGFSDDLVFFSLVNTYVNVYIYNMFMQTYTLIQTYGETTLDSPHIFILLNNTKGSQTNSVNP